MLELTATQVRREHTADGPLIRGAIRVAADIAVHRTDIQAGAAADAVQHLALFGVCQQTAAAVVEQHDVKLFRAVSFSRLAWSGDQRAIRGDRLAGAGGGESGPKSGEIDQTRNHLLNSC